jgi:hypothetical protein
VVFEVDQAIRAGAFAYLDAITRESGGLVTRVELESFSFDGRVIRLIAPQHGIWRPRFLEAPSLARLQSVLQSAQKRGGASLPIPPLTCSFARCGDRI